MSKTIEINYKTESGYEALFPVADVSSIIPSGIIVAWSGNESNIPSGWVLCNGQNNTPDLRGRFILGVSDSHAVNSTGGEETHTLSVNEMPRHDHQLATEWVGGSADTRFGIDPIAGGKYQGNMGTNNSGGNQPHNNMPPYYALCYIMKQ